jgi:ATP-dependent DNA helicase RecG
MKTNTELVRELLYQIRLGEDSAYEFKAVSVADKKVTKPHRDSLADELAAFANGKGGVLLLGVNDKTRAVEGIRREDLDTVDLWLGNLTAQAIDPPLFIETRLVEVPDSTGEPRPLVYVRVDKSLYVHRSPHGYFHRVGSSKREMPPDLLARLFQQRSMTRLLRFDEQIVPRTSPDNIDPALQERFLRADLPAAIQLKKLYLLGEDEEQKPRDASRCLTVSGVLLLTPRPADFLSSAYIQCVAYQGVERDGDAQLDAQDCDGPLDDQIHCALAFVKRHMRVEAVKRPGRIDIPQYDLRAVYEAVVNAVAHRDYSIHGARIRLHLFRDRLELSSPGGLPNTLTVESMDANSISRNETLVNLLSRYYPADPLSKRQNLIERRGEGVPMILRHSEKLSLRRPLYELCDHSELKLTIYAASRERSGLIKDWDEEQNHAN